MELLKKILYWLEFALLFVWQFPQALVALVMMPFLGKLTLVYRHKFTFCFRGEKMNGGISLGPFAFVSPISSKSPATIAHETKGHTWDSYRMGPLYLLIIGIPSILNAIFDFTECYYDFYPEARANYHAGLEVDKNCRTKFKNQDDAKEIIEQNPFLK